MDVLIQMVLSGVMGYNLLRSCFFVVVYAVSILQMKDSFKNSLSKVRNIFIH